MFFSLLYFLSPPLLPLFSFSFSLSYALGKVENSIVCMILILGLDLAASLLRFSNPDCLNRLGGGIAVFLTE